MRRAWLGLGLGFALTLTLTLIRTLIQTVTLTLTLTLALTRRVQLVVQRAEVADEGGRQAAHPRAGEQPCDRPVARGERAEGGEGAAPFDEGEGAARAWVG